MKRRKFINRCVGTGVALSLSSVFPGFMQTGNAKTLVKIGAVLNLSGAGAVDEQLLREGAALRAALVNEAGGIAETFEIEMVFEDAKTSTVGATEAANRLANRGDISFVIGPLIGNQALATQPIFAAADISQIGFAGEAQFTQQHSTAPLSMRYGFIVPLQTAPLLKYAVTELDQSNIFILGQDSGFGRDFSDAVRAQLAQLGRGSLAGEPEFYPFFNTDFSTLMTKALSSGANAIFIGTGVPIEIISAAQEFVRQASGEVGFYAQHTPSTLSPITLGYQALNNVLPTGQFNFTWFYDGNVERAFERPPSATILELEAAVEAKYKRPTSAMEGWGWGGVQIILQALEGLMQAESNAVLAADPILELPSLVVDYALNASEETGVGPVFNTPFGDQGFFSCGQFNQHEGVATFKDGKIFLLKDRGYAAELVPPLCGAA